MGATHIRLAKATRDVLTGALRTTWQLRAEKNAAIVMTQQKILT